MRERLLLLMREMLRRPFLSRLILLLPLLLWGVVPAGAGENIDLETVKLLGSSDGLTV